MKGVTTSTWSPLRTVKYHEKGDYILTKFIKSASTEELIKFCKNIIRYSLNNIEQENIEQEDKEPLG